MHGRIGSRLSSLTILGAVLALASPTMALASPVASTAVLATGAQQAAITPDHPRHVGFALMPAYPGGSFNICLLNSNHYCLESNGVGQQVTITNVAADWSVFTRKSLALEVFNIENGNGNCLRENESNEVVIANGGCLSSDRDGQWFWPEDTSGSLTGVYQNNEYSSDDMLVSAPVNGYKVWAKAPGSGDWTKWAPPGAN